MAEITIEVFADTQGSGQCRSCQRAIVWAVVVASGKKMPFDGDQWAVLSQRTEDDRLILRVDRRTNHWATCPGAALFKGKARR